jgi:uncharacterized protein YbjT (DUF2867 family)
MYVITGATGKVGGGLAERLLKDGKQVKAIGRSDAKLAALAKQGALKSVGDAADAVFLAKNFAGAECVFLMVPPDMATPDVQGHYDRMGDALVKALKESGVKTAALLSSVGADIPKGNGPVAGLYRLEQKLNSVPGLDLLVARPGYFMENQYGNLGMIKHMGINGGALRGDLAFPQIATRDISEYLFQRLRKKDWKGHEIAPLLGPKDLSMDEATAVLGKAIGKPDLKYVQFPYPEALKGMVGAGLSQSIAESFVEMSKGFNEGIIPIPKRSPANTTPTTIEQFAQDFVRVYQAP